jgi:hypothetical protein
MLESSSDATAHAAVMKGQTSCHTPCQLTCEISISDSSINAPEGRILPNYPSPLLVQT